MNNLEEMDTFWEIYKQTRLNHEQIEKLRVLMIIKEISNQIPANTQTLWPDNFTGKFCQIFKEELMPILRLFQKTEGEAALSNLP